MKPLWRSGFLALAAFGVLAGCASGQLEPPDDDTVEVEVRARVAVCAPEMNPDGISRICDDLPLPHADVEITSGGQTLWTGVATDDTGIAIAQFPDPGRDFVITVNSAHIEEELTSDPLSADPNGNPLTEYVTSTGYYLLEWLQEGPFE